MRKFKVGDKVRYQIFGRYTNKRYNAVKDYRKPTKNDVRCNVDATVKVIDGAEFITISRGGHEWRWPQPGHPAAKYGEEGYVELVTAVDDGVEISAPEPEGKKYDSGKPALELLPPKSLIEVGKVLEYGAQKYSPDNWRKVSPRERYLGAALRHITAILDGEELDGESDLPHAAHAITSLMFYYDIGEQR